MGKNPFGKRPPDKPRSPLKPWELKTIPEFYWDGEFNFWFKCPHMQQFEIMPNSVWTMTSEDPLTVTPSIHNIRCGCHGWITDDKWIPTSEPSQPEERYNHA